MSFNVQNSSGFREMSSGCAEFMFVVPRFCWGFDVPGLSAPGWWFPLWRGMVNIQQLVVSACSIFTRPWGQEGWLHFGYLLFIPTRWCSGAQWHPTIPRLSNRSMCKTWLKNMGSMCASCWMPGCQKNFYQRRHVSISDLIFWSLGFWECFTWSTPEGSLAVLSKILDVERIVFADLLSSGHILCFCEEITTNQVFRKSTYSETWNIRWYGAAHQDAGAMIFVCGRSHPMPSQVFDSFVEVLELNGMTKDAATSRLRAMQRSLVVEAWSMCGDDWWCR